jgi:hypothetical protein
VKEQVKASTMAEAQRTLLVDLITKWSGIVNDGFCGQSPRRDQGGLSETYSSGAGHDA